MVLVCYNVFGLFVQRPSWSVEGEQGIETACMNMHMYHLFRITEYILIVPYATIYCPFSITCFTNRHTCRWMQTKPMPKWRDMHRWHQWLQLYMCAWLLGQELWCWWVPMILCIFSWLNLFLNNPFQPNPLSKNIWSCNNGILSCMV